MSAPVVIGPKQVPELRHWLHDGWKPGRPFYEHAEAHQCRSPDHSRLAGPESYARWEREHLETATLWWVSAEMVDLLLAAASALPDDMTYDDLPPMPPSGMMVFEKPWQGLDAENGQAVCRVDAMLWGTANLPKTSFHEASRSLTVSMYRKLDFTQGMGQTEMLLAVNTGALGLAERMPLAERPDGLQVVMDPKTGAVSDWAPDLKEADERNLHRGDVAYRVDGHVWCPLGRTDWPMGQEIGEKTWQEMADWTHRSMVEDRKVLAAFWVLIHQQGIAQKTIVQAGRPTERRAVRAGFAKRSSDVQVVMLRRLERTEPGESTGKKVEWQHRWVVGPFWRWQPFGPGRMQRRLTFIAPYVKGPDDKPLKVKERVHAWVR